MKDAPIEKSNVKFQICNVEIKKCLSQLGPHFLYTHNSWLVHMAYMDKCGQCSHVDCVVKCMSLCVVYSTFVHGDLYWLECIECAQKADHIDSDILV